MDSNYIIAYKTEWDKLKKLNLLDISKRLNIKYDCNNNLLIVPFFNENYILNIKEESIHKQVDNTVPTIDDSIIILNYLTYSTEYIINDNKWVTLKEIPNGGVLFYPAFYKLTLNKVINNFGYNSNYFEKICLNLNGTSIDLGDKGFEFNILPKINLRIAIWEGDDEIAPNATILYNPCVQYLLHIESIIGLGMSLTNKITSY